MSVLTSVLVGIGVLFFTVFVAFKVIQIMNAPRSNRGGDWRRGRNRNVDWRVHRH
jgi:hypothetical protein